MPRPNKRRLRMNSSEARTSLAPGASYLVLDRPILDGRGEPITALSTKCEHASTRGQWVVAWAETFFPFIHANNLQKDIWLNDAETEAEQTERIALLRWLCHECGTVQEP